MFVVVADPDVMPAFERALLEAGDFGFTVVPQAWGRGRHGMHAGDRVHPGGSSVLFTVVPQADVARLEALLRGVRQGEGAPGGTRVFQVAATEWE